VGGRLSRFKVVKRLKEALAYSRAGMLLYKAKGFPNRSYEVDVEPWHEYTKGHALRLWTLDKDGYTYAVYIED
jgi:hypothetical protein